MRLLWISLGLVALALGLAGVVLPLVPTTPFMILAAALMPPKLDDLAEELLANCFFMIDSSSSMADG